MKNGDELLKKLNALEDSTFADDLMMAVNDCITMVQAAAKDSCPTHHGELKNSIHTMTEEKDDKITSVCYTDKEYAAYVEFGTGPVGLADHNGIAPAGSGQKLCRGFVVREYGKPTDRPFPPGGADALC